MDIEINGRALNMEVDTGAAVFIISKTTYQKLFSEIPIKPASLRLRTYTGEPIDVEGEMTAQVKYVSQIKDLGLIVVSGDGPSLFGRNWLYHFLLDWKRIGLATLETCQARVNVLLKRYKDVFIESLGTMKHFQAKLRVRPGTTLVFHRSCPVPFAVKDAIDRELRCLEKAEIMEKVLHSEWAAPVVVVLKGDGKIRLCGDFKATVNKSLEVNQHLLPKSHKLFTALPFFTFPLENGMGRLI